MAHRTRSARTATSCRLTKGDRRWLTDIPAGTSVAPGTAIWRRKKRSQIEAGASTPSRRRGVHRRRHPHRRGRQRPCGSDRAGARPATSRPATTRPTICRPTGTRRRAGPAGTTRERRGRPRTRRPRTHPARPARIGSTGPQRHGRAATGSCRASFNDGGTGDRQRRGPQPGGAHRGSPEPPVRLAGAGDQSRHWAVDRRAHQRPWAVCRRPLPGPVPGRLRRHRATWTPAWSACATRCSRRTRPEPVPPGHERRPAGRGGRTDRTSRRPDMNR